MVLRRNTREQTMTSVRSPHPAGPFVAIQSEGVSRKVFTPEDFFEPLTQSFGLVLQLLCRCFAAQQQSQFARDKFRCVHITLHFAQSDWRFCKNTVAVENRVLRI